MTGDGAVVRVDHRWAKAWSDNMARRDNAALASSINVARAYLEQIELIEALRSDLNVATINVHGFTRKYHEEQAHALAQAAEIERLTRELEEANNDAARYSAKAIENGVNAHTSEARTADLLKALERYGRHEVSCPVWVEGDPDEMQTGGPCRCGLAAAKGETV